MTDQPTASDVSLRKVGNVTIETMKVSTSAGPQDVPHYRVDKGTRVLSVQNPGEAVTKAR